MPCNFYNKVVVQSQGCRRINQHRLRTWQQLVRIRLETHAGQFDDCTDLAAFGVDADTGARRGTLVEVEDSTGNPVVMPNVVPRLSETPGKVTSTGPLLGDATERVLQQMCGLDADAVARLREKGVV